MYMTNLTKTRKYIVDTFLGCLKEDIIPFQKGWKNTGNFNAASGYHYHGINGFILKLVSDIEGYEDPRWMTFNQIKKCGCRLSNAKGKGIPVEFWSLYDTERKCKISQQEADEICNENPNNSNRIIPISRCYIVFNASLVEGIKPYEKGQIKDHVFADAVLNSYLENEHINLIHRGDNAYYEVNADRIVLPHIISFRDEVTYLDTLAHEIAHSTGAKERLNRNLEGHKGSSEYAIEELRAEIASAYINPLLGIPITSYNVNRHKAYIQNWIQIVEGNPQILFKAIMDAEKISEFVLERSGYDISLINDPSFDLNSDEHEEQSDEYELD